MDIIESVLLTDPRYVAQLEAMEEYIERTPLEQLEEEYQETTYPKCTTAITEECFDHSDNIDREVEYTLDAMEDDIDGDIIDIVSGLGGEY